MAGTVRHAVAASAPTILLLGPRGAGKTTVGRALAGRLGLPFFDLDDRVRARFGGRGAVDIWRTEGEAAWRRVEADEAVALLASRRCVVALGGGTPMIDAARAAIETSRRDGRTITILLLPPVAVLEGRLRRDGGGRPSLTGGDVAAEAAAVLALRLPTYRALADCELVTDDGPVDATIDRIVAALERPTERVATRS